MPTVKPTIGVFGGIFKSINGLTDGRLLVKRRGPDESLPGDWDLPGGAIEVDAAQITLDERLIFQELTREVAEEIGIDISIFGQAMPAMYPAVSKGGTDFAFAIIVGLIDVPETENIRYVNLNELEALANGPVGNRLVSGPGKRMHRLCLRMLASGHSPSPDRIRAGKRLQQIQEEMGTNPFYCHSA